MRRTVQSSNVAHQQGTGEPAFGGQRVPSQVVKTLLEG
jgi:hypothetical protein